jgi:hypothetical protein
MDSCSNAHRGVAGLGTHSAASTSRYVTESLFPVIVPPSAAPTKAMAAHDVIDVTALDVTATKVCGECDMRGGTCGSGAE